jgi:hypothetical protein
MDGRTGHRAARRATRDTRPTRRTRGRATRAAPTAQSGTSSGSGPRAAEPQGQAERSGGELQPARGSRSASGRRARTQKPSRAASVASMASTGPREEKRGERGKAPATCSRLHQQETRGTQGALLVLLRAFASGTDVKPDLTWLGALVSHKRPRMRHAIASMTCPSGWHQSVAASHMGPTMSYCQSL